MYVFDTSTLPLLIIQISGALTDTDMAKMEEGMQWGLTCPTKYVCVTLARRAARPDATARKRITEITDAGKQNDNCLAIGIVVVNDFVAGALRAIRWVTPSPRPEKAFSAAAAALAWLQPYADAAGLAVTEEARAKAIAIDRGEPG